MIQKEARRNWRLWLVVAVISIAALTLMGRLAQLQVLDHERYEAEARANHFSKETLSDRRGALLDRNGYPLAASQYAYDLLVERRVWEDASSASAAASKLAAVVSRPADELIAAARESAAFEATVATGLNPDQAAQVRKLGLRGVRLVNDSHRAYPEGNVAGQLLGFVGKDNNGLTGLEADLDAVLTGSKGSLVYERDGMGNQLAVGQRSEVAASPGADVVLTIDRYIQRIVEKELDEAIKTHKAVGGTIIVVQPKTGEILAMANRPSFDITSLDLQDGAQPDLYRNRAVTDQYEPGSVFKLVTTAAALDTGTVTPDTRWYDSGVFRVDGWGIYNWDFSANGSQTVQQFLSKSLNTGAAWLSKEVGAEVFYDYVARFGFGSATGIGLSGEVSGQVRTPENDPEWRNVDMATNSFGQGITATPLQIAMMVATIANNGLAMKPHIVRETISEGSRQTVAPEPLQQVISAQSAETLRKMMGVVADGVPKMYLDVKGYRVGGKTGTANIASDTGGYRPDAYISSFAGIAPLDDPAIAVLVKIDEPKDVPWGTVVAAPAFGRIAQAALAYLRVPPDQPALVANPR